MDPYRLPRTVVPSRYELLLRPILDTATFEGTVIIRVIIAEPVAEIVLNAVELTIASAIMEIGDRHLAGTIDLDVETERCRLTFAEALPVGSADLVLVFSGTLNDKMRGFYLSRFRDASGVEQRIAATQFEATDARRAFPCWDEPSFKAVFSTTLSIPLDLVALSNTAIAGEQIIDSIKHVHFADTIALPTYLLAFIVGPLAGSEPVMVGPTAIRAWCVPGKLPMTRLGLDVASSSLKLFEEYYDLPYPGGKLDLVALPDFAAGAMENFGCITFRETALLVDEATATHPERERIADVVAHENAHLWFGDLVTMRWWNGLWLNEAFATFMEMLAVDAYRPQWQRWTTFGVSRSAAFLVDGLASSRPVEFPVHAPRDAEAMFDVLTYEKGASVLRMLQQYLGEDVFRDGVRLYLKKHAFGNTETSDLWDGLAAASRVDVGAIMHGWIFQAGYPLLTARLEGDELVLAQQRFTYLPASGDASPSWAIPVQVRVDIPVGTSEQRIVLRHPEQRLSLPSGFALVLVNHGGHGFYRVRYEGELLRRVLDHLPTLAPIERFNLVNDFWASVQAGLTPVSDYLDLTARFRQERDRNVWSVLLASFTYLARIIDEVDRPGLAWLIRDRVGPMAADLGWLPGADEDELIDPLRGDLLRVLGTLGEEGDVQRQAARVFAEQSGGPSVRSAVVAILAYSGDETLYADFLARLRSAKTPQDEQRFLLALTGFRSSGLVARTLELALDGSVRPQDTPQVIRALLQQPHSRAQAWAFFQSRWEELSRRFAGPGLRRLCEGVIGLATAPWEQEVQSFFTSRNIVLGGKTVEQFLEQLHIAVVMRQRAGSALHEYFRDNARK